MGAEMHSCACMLPCCLLALLFQSARVLGDDDTESYHVIDVALEEPTSDAVEIRRRWEDAKADTNRDAALAEAATRTKEQLDAAMAAQQALSQRLRNLVRQKDYMKGRA